MPKQTFILNGKTVTVDVNDDVRVLWVLRDLLKVTGPKYGCGINVCKACTSHINGKAFNPCSVKVGDLKPRDRVTTIEGLAATTPGDLHPMQQAWIDHDVAQCGYCQPGQIMAAVALVKKVKALSSEGMASAFVLSALPLFLIGITMVGNPAYYTDKFSDPVFWPFVMGILALYAVGWVAIQRIINFKY